MSEVINLAAVNFAKDLSQGVGRSPYFGATLIQNLAKTLDIVGFRFAAEGGMYELSLAYAAKTSRPCDITINGVKVAEGAAGNTTGGWSTVKWETVGMVELQTGDSILRLTPPKTAIPHFQHVKLVWKSPPPEPDDLTRIEGIGPKISGLLQAEGITTFSHLAARSGAEIDAILDAAGNRYATAKPGTWPEQAALAAAQKWDELKRLQAELDGGVRAD